jgi:hypothetical protein
MAGLEINRAPTIKSDPYEVLMAAVRFAPLLRPPGHKDQTI